MEPLFLDTETTGFGQCRLIELAYAHLNGPITSFRCRPPIAIEEGATAVHGITAQMLAELPLSTDCPQYPEAKRIIESSIVIAHGGVFDRDVLAREGIRVPRLLDTKRIARDFWPELKSHRLQDLREQFHLEGGDAHSATGDVATLRSLFSFMFQIMIRENGSSPEDVLEQFLTAAGA